MASLELLRCMFGSLQTEEGRHRRCCTCMLMPRPTHPPMRVPQAPGLPYQLPRQLASYPVLAGRAVVEVTVEKANGAKVFVDPNSSAGPQRRAKLRLVLDGYSGGSDGWGACAGGWVCVGE